MTFLWTVLAAITVVWGVLGIIDTVKSAERKKVLQERLDRNADFIDKQIEKMKVTPHEMSIWHMLPAGRWVHLVQKHNGETVEYYTDGVKAEYEVQA